MKRICIVEDPTDQGAPQRGARCGPLAIRLAGLTEKLGVLGFDVVEASSIQEEGFPLVLGGDHSVAVRTIRTISRHKRLGVIWLDAHGDMNTPDISPSGNMHGMALAACLGLIPSWSPKLVEPEDVAIIGVRDVDKLERNLIKHDFQMFVRTMEHIDRRGIHAVIEDTLRHLAKCDSIHLSLDMDVIDPKIAPGVGTPVQGGLTYREAHAAMEVLAKSGCLGSIEVVEINPFLDIRNTTAELAVELILSALGKRIL